jgi:hypothetical protein
VEGDAAARVRREPRRLQHHSHAAVEQGTAEQQRGQPGAARDGVRLDGEQQGAQRVDGRAEEPEQVWRAPQRHVETEQAVPQVVDRRGQDHEGDAPGGQVNAAEGRQPQDRDGPARAGAPPRGHGVAREDRDGDEQGDGDAAVHHQVGRDPERVPTDQQVPLDVPGESPAPEKLAGEQRPQGHAMASAGGEDAHVQQDIAARGRRVTTGRR